MISVIHFEKISIYFYKSITYTLFVHHISEKMHYNQETIQKYFQVLNQHSIVSITNLKGEIAYANENFSSISKYNQDELIGNPHSIVNSGYHPPDYFKTMWRTISRAKVWQGDIRNRAKDGSYYWVSTTIVPITENGSIKEYFSVRMEITDKVQLEKKAQLEQARYKYLFDHIKEGVIVLSKQGNDFFVIDFNTVAGQLDHLTSQQSLGKNVNEVYPAFMKLGFIDLLHQADKDGFVRFNPLLYKDELRTSWRKGELYKLPSNEIVCVFSDITEEVLQLEQLQSYNKKLEEVAFIASHELRAPVASILGLANLFDRSTIGSANQQVFDMLIQSVERLDDIIHKMVDTTYHTEEGKRLFAKLADFKKA
jgi:PAS domain S-box-containing protein